MKQRLLAILLVCTLTVTVVFPVTVKRAFADSPGGESEIYASELREYFLELKPNQESQTNHFFNLLDTALNSENNYYVCALFNDGDWLISIYSSGNLSMSTWYSFNQGSNWNGISRNANTSNINAIKYAYLYYDGTLTYNFSQTQVGLTGPIAFDFNNPGTSLNYNAFPNTYNIANYWVYTSRDILAGNMGYSMATNFFSGERPPTYETFEMLSFRLGDRYFLTLKDQSQFGLMEPVEAYWSKLVFNIHFPNDPEHEIVEMILYLDDFQKLKGIGRLVPEIVNPDNDPVLGYDITHFVGGDSPEYCIMDTFTIYQSYETPGTGNDDGAIIETLIGVSESVLTFNIDNQPQEPSARDDSWEEIADYISNYPTGQIIPLDLGEVLFGINGSKSIRCEVSFPSDIFALNGQGWYVTPDIYQFQWGIHGIDNLMYDPSIMDVAIIPWIASDMYQVIYYTGGNPSYHLVSSRLTLSEIMGLYDIVIFCFDYGNIFNHETNEDIKKAYTGSNGLGINFYNGELTYNLLNGFCILTSRAIQKQQLFNFNDGITKTYDLMVQYCDKKDKWDNSFLSWSMSVFNQLDSLNGYLDDIYKYIKYWDSLLTNISNKLDQIANNTAPEDPGYWFISFFNWVRRFEPTNQDFAFWVESWDDYTDALPDPGSGVTVIPLPTAVPTVAVGG